MVSQYKNVTEAVEDLFVILQRYPDDVKYFSFYTHFIKQLLKIKDKENAVPVIEVITVIKHERPLVFSVIKKLADDNMRMLTNVGMSIQDARTRLGRFKKNIS